MKKLMTTTTLTIEKTGQPDEVNIHKHRSSPCGTQTTWREMDRVLK